MRNLFVFIFVMGLSFMSFAQEATLDDIPKSYLVIKPFESNLVSSFEMNQINKIMLQVSSKQTTYHLLLTDQDTIEGSKNKITGLELLVSLKGDYFEIQANLNNLKDDKTIQVKRKDHILKKDLQREIYLLLESVFGIEEKKKKK